MQLKEENEQLRNELDSLNKLLTKENFSSYTIHRNIHLPMKEEDSLLMSYFVINKNFGVDSTITINLFKIQEIDTIQLDSKQHIKTFYNEGALFFSIKNLKKGTYFITSEESQFNKYFFYEWEIN